MTASQLIVDATRVFSQFGLVFSKAYIIIAMRLRHDYNEKLACSFLLASNRVEWSGRARYVVVVS